MGLRLSRSVSHYSFFGNYLDAINPQKHVPAKDCRQRYSDTLGQEILPFHSKHERETQTYHVGLDKILISPDGEIPVTNDWSTILSQMEVEHQTSRLLAQLSKSQGGESEEDRKSTRLNSSHI